MRIRSLSYRVLVVIGLALGLGLAGVTSAAAQDAGTPLDLSGAIHTGTCESLGETASYQVGDFIPVNDAEIVGSQDIEFTLRAQQTLQTNVDDLFNASSPFAFVVLDNADPEAGPVACGELGGVQVNGLIVVGLSLVDSTMAAGQERVVGVAVFGTTEPTGPTTQPPTTPGQLPVQAYISEDALTQAPETTPTTTAAPTQAPPAAASPTATATVEPTMEPTTEPTLEPTLEPTMEPTTEPTAEPTAAPTEAPTMEPTLEPTVAPPTVAPPTEAPPTEAPPTTEPTSAPV